MRDLRVSGTATAGPTARARHWRLAGPAARLQASGSDSRVAIASATSPAASRGALPARRLPGLGSGDQLAVAVGGDLAGVDVLLPGLGAVGRIIVGLWPGRKVLVVQPELDGPARAAHVDRALDDLDLDVLVRHRARRHDGHEGRVRVSHHLVVVRDDVIARELLSRVAVELLLFGGIDGVPVAKDERLEEQDRRADVLDFDDEGGLVRVRVLAGVENADLTARAGRGITTR